jgi:uncharacterized protein (TIGR03382 family)
MIARDLAFAGMSLVLAGSTPAMSAGHAPSQASGPLGVTALAGKYTGAGVTIGVISDSFNNPNCDPVMGPGQCATTADQDISSGNLPGPGNPNADTTPVTVLQDGNFKGQQDQGRAMLQIIYGLAPKARLCFATYGNGSMVSFAQAIASLASAAGCKANVIVDDGVVSGNSFFADDQDTAAVNQAVAEGVVYVSAAGDLGPALYDGTFKVVPDAVARAGTFGNLDLSQVPPSLTAGGFHDFSTSGAPQISFTTGSDGVLSFGWDDLPSPANPSADYHLLIFDANGNYRADLGPFDSGPLQSVFIGDVPSQIVISLGTPATATSATRLRLLGFPFVTSGLPSQTSAPSISGHMAAAGGISVAAYRCDLSAPESVDSLGPYINAFDASGNRRAVAETRLKPDLAGVDGLDATFAVPGSADSDHDGFPNAFGSSIAAASVAAVAALTIEASGGAATPAQVASWLKQSASHASTWSASDGYGYVNAVQATALAAASRPIVVDPPLNPPPPVASAGCGTAGSLAPLWMLAALAFSLLRARRLRRH